MGDVAGLGLGLRPSALPGVFLFAATFLRYLRKK